MGKLLCIASHPRFRRHGREHPRGPERVGRNGWHCPECGHDWIASKRADDPLAEVAIPYCPMGCQDV